MGYKDVKELKGSNTYVDVDSLSPSLDVTPQLIDVVDMGELLTHMGCDSVRIDVENRDFQAIGSFGSVRTEELPGVGKVLRFQRYPPKNCQDLSSEWRGNIHYHSEAWRCKGKLLMRGKFAIDTFDDPLYMDPLSLRAMMRNEADRMMSALKDNVSSFNVPW
jgi:hypothetical protein